MNPLLLNYNFLFTCLSPSLGCELPEDRECLVPFGLLSAQHTSWHKMNEWINEQASVGKNKCPEVDC